MHPNIAPPLHEEEDRSVPTHDRDHVRNDNAREGRPLRVQMERTAHHRVPTSSTIQSVEQRLRASTDNHRTHRTRRHRCSLRQTDGDDRCAENGREAGKGSRKQPETARTQPVADKDAKHGGKAAETVDVPLHPLGALWGRREGPAQHRTDDGAHHHDYQREKPNVNSVRAHDGLQPGCQEGSREPHDEGDKESNEGDCGVAETLLHLRGKHLPDGKEEQVGSENTYALRA